MLAGFEKAKGEFIAVMDGDLQNPPSFLPLMYADLKTGEYDCIATRRKDRNGEEKFRSWLSVKFYDIMNKMSDTKVIKSTQDFRMMSRQYLDAVLSMREYNRFSKGIFAWVGFRIKYMPYDNIERAAGTTSWPLWKLFLYAIEGIVSFSVAPLAISIVLGAITAFIGFVMFILAFIGLFTDSFTSDTMAIFASIFFVGGLIMGCMGTLGLYISKSYTEIKNRPVYIVRCSNINS
jgi:glycosyltransferase involved in cell wall biosynthesis